MTLDPYALAGDLPSEWAQIPPEILARLAPAGAIATPAQRAELNRIAAGRWFLVRNELGLRCGHCRQGILPGAVHPYISIACVEAPFHGLREIVLFMQETAGADMLLSAMRPGTLVPITRRQAEKLNARIRARGGRPIDMQRPLDPAEIDPAAIARRLARRAALARGAR